MPSDKIKILLIDDDEASHIIHKVSIEDAGVDLSNVASYYSVDQAIGALRSMIETKSNSEWPDYIFLDLNMPQKTGYDFVEEFEQLTMEFDIPKIFFVSSSINPRDIQRAEELKIVHGFKSKFIGKEFIETLVDETRTKKN